MALWKTDSPNVGMTGTKAHKYQAALSLAFIVSPLPLPADTPPAQARGMQMLPAKGGFSI